MITDRDIDRILADPHRISFAAGWPDDAKEIIKRLALEVNKLKKQVKGHCDRIAAQSEILSRRAAKG